MNHNLQLLQSLYLAASGKYRKYKVRLDKAVHTGRFYKLNKRKQSFLVSRLRRLYERLKSLQAQLRLAGAGAALALTLSVSNPLQAQSTLGPFDQNDASNPLPPPITIQHPRPAVIDIDNDGDLDVFVGVIDGSIKFYRNDSPAGSVTRFTELTGTDNPLDGVNEGNDPAPAFADVDGDGDFDMLLGTGFGNTYFFKNTGTRTSPVFTQQTGSNNPFDGITGTHSAMYGNSEAIPTFVDFDEDSDIDLFIGSSYVYDIETGSHPAVEYYENNGGVFSQTAATGLGGALEFLSKVTLTFADVNDDSGLDALVGTSGSQSVRCFVQGIEAQFTEQSGGWDPIAKTGNPFNNFWFYKYASPIAADFDKDGDLDFLVGVHTNYYSEDLTVRYFENTDGNFSLEFITGLNVSPFGGVDVGDEASPVFSDIDNDGDLDAVLGEKYGGNFNVFVNTNGIFYIDQEHQLSDILLPLNNTYDVIPVFADIDNDGDQDLFASMDRDIAFFRNDNGTFVNETSPINPSSLYNLSLALIDVDKDGDLDALIGHYSYEPETHIEYFQNTGSGSVPNFEPAIAPAPFEVEIFENNPTLFAVDIDHDGDTDLIISDSYETGSYEYGYYHYTRTLFYENNGDGTFSESDEPLFTENTSQSFTSYTDLDSDGDLDAFIGGGRNEEGGKVFFYKNTNPAPLTETEMSDIVVIGGSPMIIAPDLTITDDDNDDITFATVTISDFVPGEEVLNFTPQAGINGLFDDELGVLTFNGKASLANYQTLLRSVTIDFTGNVPNARTSKSASVLNLLQSITFQVRDVDFTLTTVAVVSLNILPGNELTIYNAVSPNKGDDFNSFLRIAAIETVSPKNTVTIYNRWGDVVFEVKDYNNSEPSKRFEGVNKNGKDLPSGTYFYKIEITGKTVTGYLSLKR